MIHNSAFKQFEFILLFIVFPLLFLLKLLPISFLIPILWMLSLYAFFILKRMKHQVNIKLSQGIHFKGILVRFFVLSLLFLILSYIYYPQTFFDMLINESKLFLLLLVLYPLLSVIPQEVLYREFFFKRYAFKLHTNTQLLLNALIFMWAHMVFGNSVVFGLTFIAGVLFAHTYLKSRSFILVCVEHTLYGYLLFVSGLGELFFQSGTLNLLRTFFE